MQVQNYPVVILVAPQLALNVGMVARVMLNFNFCELRLVTPRDKEVINNALAASAGADIILKNSKIFASLKDAVADLNIVYAASKRLRYLNKPAFSLFNAFSDIDEVAANCTNRCSVSTDTISKKIGFLFGKESSGLSNSDLNYASALISIDTNPSFGSLNLAQAVALFCYEWTKSKDVAIKANKELPLNKLKLQESIDSQSSQAIDNINNKKIAAIAATFADLEHLFSYLEINLTQKNFFGKAKKATMVNNFRNIFLKNQLSRSEVKTLFSIFKALNNNL